MRSMATTMTPPTAPRGFRRAKRTTVRPAWPSVAPRPGRPIRREGSRRTAGIERVGCDVGGDPAPSDGLVPDPRVEQGIEGIHGQVDQHDDRDDDQVDALDDGIVPLRDGLEEEAAHTWQAEDRFDDDRAAEDL